MREIIVSIVVPLFFGVALLPMPIYGDDTQAQASVVEDKEKRYTLFAGGDFFLARRLHATYYRYGAEYLVKKIKDRVKKADVALVNIEAVISSRGHFFYKREKRPHLYRGRPELLDLLTVPGFDVAAIANNHSMDYGPDALLEEIALLKASGIAPVGGGENLSAASEPTYVQVDDIVIAFIGLASASTTEYTVATENRAGIFHAKEYKGVLNAMREPVARARQHAHLVVFTPHWGRNWEEKPTPERVALAHDLIDLGVDAILGHSAHVLQPIEIYKGKPILYDMGTFFPDWVGIKETSMGKKKPLTPAFTLEFTKEGFQKVNLEMVQLYPYRNPTEEAQERKKMQDRIIASSNALNNDVAIQKQGDLLTVSFSPTVIHPGPTKNPKTIHRTGQTRPLPDTYRQRKTNVVVDIPPTWTTGFKPVKLDNGVVVLGYRHGEAVRPKRGFASEVALKVPGPITDRLWQGVVRCEERDGDETFTWTHPIADGGWLPPKWEKNQIVIDRTLVRSKIKNEGTFDLYWGMKAGKHWAKPLSPIGDRNDGMVPIGSIHVMKSGIPDGPPGIAWDGILANVETELNPLKLIIGIVMLLVALLGVSIYIHQQKRRSSKK